MLKQVAVLSLTLGLIACTDSLTSTQGEGFNDGLNTGELNTTFDRQALLINLVDNVITPIYQNFHTQAESLTEQTFCNDFGAQNTEHTTVLNNAQNAWVDAMSAWQQVEMLQLSPLTTNDGQLRNVIYSWPTVSQCAVDQDVGYFELGVVSGSVYNINNRTNTRRGLDALEYLLFNNSLQHSCSNNSLAPKDWNLRSDSERLVARCNYASEVALDIEKNAQTLLDDWLGDGGYAEQIKSAGAAGSAFDSQQAAINHITDALFYLDSITKDSKLASPIGLSANSCGSASCVADIESQLSHNAISNIENNLLAMAAIFTGGEHDALGFDDFLTAVDAKGLSDEMIADLNSAIELSQQFESTMTDAVTNNPEDVQQLYQAVKKVTDNLKSVFITYLALELPASSAGDAD